MVFSQVIRGLNIRGDKSLSQEVRNELHRQAQSLVSSKPTRGVNNQWAQSRDTFQCYCVLFCPLFFWWVYSSSVAIIPCLPLHQGVRTPLLARSLCDYKGNNRPDTGFWRCVSCVKVDLRLKIICSRGVLVIFTHTLVLCWCTDNHVRDSGIFLHMISITVEYYYKDTLISP